VLSGKAINLRLYYHHGEYPPCSNLASTKTGLGVKVGDRIEGFGVHSVKGQSHIVDLCCLDCKLVVLNSKK
jgi:hypothetical protein